MVCNMRWEVERLCLSSPTGRTWRKEYAKKGLTMIPKKKTRNLAFHIPFHSYSSSLKFMKLALL